MADFKVRGLIELERTLRSFPDKVQSQILGSAVEGMAEIVEQEAEQLAPRRTGKLIRNIGRVQQKSRKDRVQWNVGVRRRVYYWKFQELGSARNAAHPFLRPAASNKAVEALAEFKKRFVAGLARTGVR